MRFVLFRFVLFYEIVGSSRSLVILPSNLFTSVQPKVPQFLRHFSGTEIKIGFGTGVSGSPT